MIFDKGRHEIMFRELELENSCNVHPSLTFQLSTFSTFLVDFT